MAARRPTFSPPERFARPARPGRLVLGALAAAAVALGGVAAAFEDLNEAQALVYDTPHLAATAAGDELRYRYRAVVGDAPAVDDRATLVVDAEGGPERRDVTLDFLSDARRLELPPFAGYRGNPIVIATLEHLAQTLAASAGGGALYVRNRIRDGLARDDVTLERGRATHGDETIETAALTFSPFAGDAFLGARPGFGDATFRLVFSDDVPGGVVSIEALSGASAEASNVAGRARGVPFAYALRLADDVDG